MYIIRYGRFYAGKPFPGGRTFLWTTKEDLIHLFTLEEADKLAKSFSRLYIDGKHVEILPA